MGQKKKAASTKSQYTTKILSDETFTVNGVSFTMTGVQGGVFTMGATPEQGSDAADDETRHRVAVNSFRIGQTEVTQQLWKAVMGNNPAHFVGNDNPVDCVTWHDCQKFIRKLNQLTGRKFRLPTEAEWEYAARGGNQSRGYKYAGSNDIEEVAWYKGGETHAVATKKPNELGIYDMAGNVHEWCQDWYGKYSTSSQSNPTGPSSGTYRVVRGGAWGNYTDKEIRTCRITRRGMQTPSAHEDHQGMRLAL